MGTSLNLQCSLSLSRALALSIALSHLNQMKLCSPDQDQASLSDMLMREVQFPFHLLQLYSMLL